MGIILAYWKTGHIGVINRITRYAKVEFQFDFGGPQWTVHSPNVEFWLTINYSLHWKLFGLNLKL